MNAEIITIGDEILLGQIVDTNSAWIGQQLNLLNIRTQQITSISDSEQAITEALHAASLRADIIIVTGGLGPTKDDVTKQTISTFFGKPLVRDDKVLAHVKNLFNNLAPGRVLPEINYAQADVVEGCQVLFNDVGTAPGMLLTKNEKMFFFLPGVPFEMKFLITHRVIPILRERRSDQHIEHRHIITVGIGESFLAEKIKDIEESLPDSIKLAYLPKVGMVRLRLTQTAPSPVTIDFYHQQLIERLGTHVVADKDISVEQAIVEAFTKDKLKLAAAESCTGGRIASGITAIAGASAIFDCGIVAYHNRKKMQVLGVKAETLDTVGAVSEETVIEMAQGVKKLAHADYAIATSGIAGPGGGTPDKPVGTVWIAVAGKYETVTRLFHFRNDRSINIERTVANAYSMLWNLYVKEKEK